MSLFDVSQEQDTPQSSTLSDMVNKDLPTGAMGSMSPEPASSSIMPQPPAGSVPNTTPAPPATPHASMLQLALRGFLAGAAHGMGGRTVGQGIAMGADAGSQVAAQDQQDKAAAEQREQQKQEAADRHTMVLANLQAHNVQMMGAMMGVRNASLDYYTKLGSTTQGTIATNQEADGFKVYGTGMDEPTVKQKYLELHQQDPNSRVTFGVDPNQPADRDDKGEITPRFVLYDPGNGSVTLDDNKLAQLKNSGILVPKNVQPGMVVPTTLLNKWRSDTVQKMAIDKQQADIDEKRSVINKNNAEAGGAGVPKSLDQAQGLYTAAVTNYNTNPNDPAAKQRMDAAKSQLEGFANLENEKLIQKKTVDLQTKREGDQEDIDFVAHALVDPNNLTALKNISSIRGDQRLRIYEAAKKLDPNFDPAKTDLKVKYLDNFNDPNGKVQNGLNAGNTFIKHAWDLKNFVDTELSGYRGGNIPGPTHGANTSLNKFEKSWGGQTYGKLMGYLTPVRMEYTNALKAGYAPDLEDTQAVKALFDPAATPKNIEDAMYIALQTITKRMDSTNGAYKRVVGQNIPDLFDEDAKDSLDHMGMTGVYQKYGTNTFQNSPSTPAGGSKPVDEAPPTSSLTQGKYTTFKNGQTWTLIGGKATRIK